MLSLLISAALAFTPSDAALAHRSMSEFVSKCTPRDAGTIPGKIAALLAIRPRKHDVSARGLPVAQDICERNQKPGS